MNIPNLYKWDGGILPTKWSFGYLTGCDKDLVCIAPDISDKMEAEIALSPVCRTRLYAILALVLKRLLLRLDSK